MSTLHAAGLEAAGVILGLALGAVVWLWTVVSARERDRAGFLEPKSLVPVLPVLYVLLAWTAFIAEASAKAVRQMPVPLSGADPNDLYHYDFMRGVEHVGAFVFTMAPLMAYFILMLRGRMSEKAPECQILGHARHMLWALIYTPLCLAALIVFSFWPHTLDTVFGWAKMLNARI